MARGSGRAAALSLLALGLLLCGSLVAGQAAEGDAAADCGAGCAAQCGGECGGGCEACGSKCSSDEPYGWGQRCDTCGGGMCGLATECTTDVAYTPSYNVSRECGELLSATIRNGISAASACLRPELSATEQAGSGNVTGTVTISSNGCPDHKYFRDVRRANSDTCQQGYGTTEDPRCGNAEEPPACDAVEAVPEGETPAPEGARRQCDAACGGGDGMSDAAWSVDLGSKYAFSSGYDTTCTKEGRMYACALIKEETDTCSTQCAYHGAEMIKCAACGCAACGCAACGCAACGCAACGCAACAAGCGGIGKYTPVKKAYSFAIPRNPALQADGGGTPVPPAMKGTMGVAVNGVMIVGHHLDAATGDAGEMTMAFDSCGGHGDLDHQYHYHIPPYCLLRSLGGTVPKRHDWWLAFHPEGQWPDRGDSPLIGWALDGFPIFGPYDPESKELQVSKDSGCTSSLDACNGKKLESGQYAYFVTPTYPYVPQCFRGTRLGNITATAPAVEEKCDYNGYNPEAEALTKDCHTIPQNLFHEIKENTDWLAATATVGAFFALLLFLQAFIIVSGVQGFQPEVPSSDLDRMSGDSADAMLKKAWWSLVFSALAIAFTRMLFLLVDPYLMRGIFPRIVESLIYGLLYPLVNMCTVEMLYLVNAIRSYVYIACIVMVFCQLIIQMTMDGLRSYGQQPSWHFICQALYAAWGLIVLGAAMFYTILNKKFLWFGAAFFSFVLVVCSIVMLSVSLGGPTDNKYFAWTTWLRVLEFVVTALYTVVAYDYLVNGSGLPDTQARLTVKKDHEQDEENPAEGEGEGQPTDGDREVTTWSKSFAPHREEPVHEPAPPPPVPEGYNETFGPI